MIVDIIYEIINEWLNKNNPSVKITHYESESYITTIPGTAYRFRFKHIESDGEHDLYEFVPFTDNVPSQYIADRFISDLRDLYGIKEKTDK